MEFNRGIAFQEYIGIPRRIPNFRGSNLRKMRRGIADSKTMEGIKQVKIATRRNLEGAERDSEHPETLHHTISPRHNRSSHSYTTLLTDGELVFLVSSQPYTE